MSIYGTCKTCGGETCDYCCWTCEHRKCQSLKSANAALHAELAAVTQERDKLKRFVDGVNGIVSMNQGPYFRLGLLEKLWNTFAAKPEVKGADEA